MNRAENSKASGCFGCLLPSLLPLFVVGYFAWSAWQKGDLYWNPNWGLKDDYNYKEERPSPRTDLNFADFLPGGHYYVAEDWSDPRVRDEAEVTVNTLLFEAGLPAEAKLRPWRDAMKRNKRYDLRRQIELMLEIDAGIAAAQNSGSVFGQFANAASFGGAIILGANSEDPYNTARLSRGVGDAAAKSLTDFWTRGKVFKEMSALARKIYLPRAYGWELDPTHPTTLFIKGYSTRFD